MPNPTENLPGIYLGAASLMCLLTYFGARNRRLGWRKPLREGDVTHLFRRWLRWNRALAPEVPAGTVAGAVQPQRQSEPARPAAEAAWRAASSGS
jgi:hypothetical protein